MAWLILLLAGLLEIVWAVGLKYTAGFTKPWPSIITLSAMIASFVLLGHALRTLPLGVAYSVWVGIGVVGTVIFGAWLFDESLSLLKIVSILLILLGIVGLKLTS
ncbi:MAG: quaternary ammonium compound efflux SMR transporter SugE [Alishewanella agri]|jgi:quaternary ammonium compound-resistance protein SugE|nr:quaternary ammonium compound efflux SMR transporter SugE [Alishewanella agri]OYW96333.1 MAG: QacE family quaternary ammonium compound efflux SMR transporter [Alishewanella sp. 32-51-5]OZB42927.1 MAG: QacE family quaternary ammonium compound efflux SMR transporter [Alishewanella sp. 34-51-39]